MAQLTDRFLKQALDLPPRARAALAMTLLDSLEPASAAEAEEVWETEIVQRLAELDEAA